MFVLVQVLFATCWLFAFVVAYVELVVVAVCCLLVYDLRFN